MAGRKYTIDDINIVGDPLTVIRKLYSRDGMEAPGASFCAAALVQQLLLMAATPAQVDQRNTWIFISSDRDWLKAEDGSVSKRPFLHIEPLLQAGSNSHRMEVLLTVFATAVVTAGTDGTEWIVGDQGRHPLPAGVTIEEFQRGCGRVVAFIFAEGVS
ncbi:MAG: hypothetical protein EPO10_28725 [Reyranella sp.]|uniref:hypothetical protein n=1 Tax=Reyranella sp. TaxID=1929291 RepID=UPI0011F97883|nr:hypothetical protein [Reyranella sp.]TAJ85349.1 MAG: hypothetical protein EPO41_27075 [Reyranella sp.]TBR22168.1 MAG: hypothetical protein EPO10_28725 [Reyranella sp.]